MHHFYYLQIHIPKEDRGDYSRIIEMAGVIILFIIIGFFVLLIFSRQRQNKLVLKQRAMKQEFQQQLLQSQIEVQEATFSALGKELHDNVGQLLSSSRMLLGMMERTMEHPPDILLKANSALGQAISEIRLLSKSLDKEWLERFNFDENLHTEISRINANDKIKVSYNLKDKIQLIADKQLILFRIVQEAIQNSIKHADPSIIDISAGNLDDRFVVSIMDDGSGFEILQTSNGMGLNNMKYRTSLLNGTIEWKAVPEGGTNVIISLPIKEDSL